MNRIELDWNRSLILITMSQPRGILRNKSVLKQVSEAELDRRKVIDNTVLNSQLGRDHNDSNNPNETDGDTLRSLIAQKHAQHPNLKWDEINLYKTEQEKCATMRIDEPKTPYEGGFDPLGEYYREDDPEEIPLLELGEGQFDGDSGHATAHAHILPGEPKIEANDDLELNEVELDEPEPAPELAEDRHKRFEEMRKAHYHLKGEALKKPIVDLDDDNDEGN